MKITIKDKEVEMKYSFRGYIIYESITGESYTGGGLSQLITMFYSFLMGSDNQLDLTFDDFVTWLDDNPDTLEEFSVWFRGIVDAKKGITKESKKTASKKKANQ